MQLRARQGQRLLACRALEQWRALAVFDIVAQGGIARRMVHMAAVLAAQLAVQGVAGVLQRDEREMALPSWRSVSAAQRAHHAREVLVGMLATADKHRPLRAGL